MPYNYDDYKMQTCALLISFYSGTANEKSFELKKVLEYFQPSYVIITCLKTSKICVCITKRDLDNMQKKKNAFLRCEDLRVS